MAGRKQREARLGLAATVFATRATPRQLLEDFALMNTNPLVRRVRLVLRDGYLQRSTIATLKLWLPLASNYGNPTGRSLSP